MKILSLLQEKFGAPLFNGEENLNPTTATSFSGFKAEYFDLDGSLDFYKHGKNCPYHNETFIASTDGESDYQECIKTYWVSGVGVGLFATSSNDFDDVYGTGIVFKCEEHEFKQLQSKLKETGLDYCFKYYGNLKEHVSQLSLYALGKIFGRIINSEDDLKELMNGVKDHNKHKLLDNMNEANRSHVSGWFEIETILQFDSDLPVLTDDMKSKILTRKRKLDMEKKLGLGVNQEQLSSINDFLSQFPISDPVN